MAALLLRNGMVATGCPVSVERADVLVQGDIIAEVSPAIEVVSEGTEVIDCSEMLLTAGFVNGHIHLNQLLNRGFLEDLSTEQLLSTMHSRHDSKSDEDRYWGSLLAIYEGLRAGTTYFSAFATSSGLIAKAMHDAGIRGTLTVAKKDQWWGDGAPEQYPTERILASLLREIQSWPYAQISLSIGAASDRAASEALLRGVKDLATAHGLRVYIHTAEGSQAVAFSLKHRGRTPIQYLADIGFLDSRVALVHACHISNEEIDQVASASTSVIHCPVSNAKTAAGLLPLRRVREAGVDVSLGTDAASSGNTNNVLVEAHFANLLHKSAATDAAYPSAEDMFCLLTVGGAKAVGAEGVIGEIRPGFKADLVLWNLGQSAFLPNYSDPVSALIYCASEIRPSRVYVNGLVVYDDGPCLFKLDDVRCNVRAYAHRLREEE